jgi:glycosyltransferase involved in cell wall biosynthesis
VKKEIVFVAGKDPELEIGGGHSSYVRAYARSAIRAGFEPHLFCTGQDDSTFETGYGIVHRTRSLWPFRPVPGMGWPGYIPASVLNVPQLSRRIDRFLRGRPGPHLFHGFSIWGAAAVTSARRIRRRGDRAVVLQSAYTSLTHESKAKMRGLNLDHRWIERLGFRREHLWTLATVTPLERRAILEADLVAVNYESVRKLLLSEFPLLRNVRKIPYSPESAFVELPQERTEVVPREVAELEPRGAPLVVSVSRHDPRKGVDVFLQALAVLKRSGVPFRAAVVGGGRLLESHRRLAGRLGLGPETVITGFVPDAGSFLRAADIFVLPSLEEGSGSLSLLEAMQAGVAPVASACDGIPEDVRDEETGLLVPPGQAGPLAAAIARLLWEPELRRRLARAARKNFGERFAAETTTAAIGSVYGELLERA